MGPLFILSSGSPTSSLLRRAGCPTTTADSRPSATLNSWLRNEQRIPLFAVGFGGPSHLNERQRSPPLGERVAKLRPQAANNPGLAQVLDETDREMAMCRRYGDSFGYVFYLMRTLD